MSEPKPQMTEEYACRRKWYRSYRFPLLPVFTTKAADKFNSADFHFEWLCFRVWSMMSPDIGVEINLDDQQLMLRARIPYLILGIFIPLSPRNWSQKTWRIPKRIVDDAPVQAPTAGGEHEGIKP